MLNFPRSQKHLSEYRKFQNKFNSGNENIRRRNFDNGTVAMTWRCESPSCIFILSFCRHTQRRFLEWEDKQQVDHFYLFWCDVKLKRNWQNIYFWRDLMDPTRRVWIRKDEHKKQKVVSYERLFLFHDFLTSKWPSKWW